MNDAHGATLGVWRVGRYRRAAGYAFAGLPSLGAASAWLTLLMHPGLNNLASAGEATAVSVGFAFFGWWTLLRVRPELTTDGIITVNPWGTHRLPWSSVSAVSLNGSGAQFHTADGFKYTSNALSNLGGWEPQEARFAAVMAIVRRQVRL
ncbi:MULTISPECIES: PH domain-containing protein [Streptomyces]|uniref:PH domain-containing protein n=2 Tax=Streptomyces TaxID=1883 RepID=UPI001F07FBCF|nr:MULTISPECIES: PH domain-containing protein [unclassified Streptomyces]